MTTVPSQYQALVQQAANSLGIPESVVASQIYYESAWNPDAVSSTGAQGLAQFEPGTWASYGSGSPTDPTQAMLAYTRYMSVLLQDEGGSLRNALAAYNAGPGNLSAGYGYADHILTDAGASGTTTVAGGTGTGGAGTPVSSQAGETVNTGSGSTCAWALGTKNKILIWNVGFSVCIFSKTEVRAFVGALMMAAGGVVTMVGVGVTMQYALDKSGVMSAVMKASDPYKGVLPSGNI